MAPLFRLNSNDPVPLYAQLERAIKLAVVTGALPIGQQLPTVRQLAVDLKINANTVAKVYAELERQGIVATRRGVGTFVEAAPAVSSLPRAKRIEELPRWPRGFWPKQPHAVFRWMNYSHKCSVSHYPQRRNRMADVNLKELLKSKDVKVSLPTPHVNVVQYAFFLIPLTIGGFLSWWQHSAWYAIVGFLFGWLISKAPKVAKQWERGIVLRLGRYIGMRGPGLFWVVPLVDSVAAWIDQRTITTNFAAEETLTSDTVPVNVDAVLFWMVYDPEKAALEVQDYMQAVSWAAQTALRDIIGRTSLTDLLRGREQIELDLQKLIDAHESLGRNRAIGRNARCRDSRSATRCDVPRSPSGTGKASADYSGSGGNGNCQLVCHRREIVSWESHRPAPARHEHAVRRVERKRCFDARPQHRGGIDGHGGPAGRRRPAPTSTGRGNERRRHQISLVANSSRFYSGCVQSRYTASQLMLTANECLLR